MISLEDKSQFSFLCCFYSFICTCTLKSDTTDNLSRVMPRFFSRAVD